MSVKYPEVTVELTGVDSNAFSIMGVVAKAMRRAGIDADEIKAFRTEAMSGSYDELLVTVMKWVNVE